MSLLHCQNCGLTRITGTGPCDECGAEDFRTFDKLTNRLAAMSTTPEEQHLAPCPFCGDESPSFERIGTSRQSCVVFCENCGARHESSDEYERSGSSWNRRAQPPAPPAQPGVTDAMEKVYFRANDPHWKKATAQPTKLSIQSLWPFKDGEIDPRSELAKVPVQSVGAPAWLLDDCRKYENKLRAIVGILRESARLVDEEGDTTDDIEAAADCLSVIAARSVPEVPAAPSVPWPIVSCYSGGAAPEGVAGRVWLRLTDGPNEVEYVPALAHPAVPDAGVACDQRSGQDTTMWAVHVQGPDDVFAAPDRKVADAVCVVLNAEFMRNAKPGDPILHAVVTEWPYGYEEWNAEKDQLHLEAIARPGQQGRMPAADAAGSDVTKAALKVIKDRDDFGWSREADDAIDALRVALSKNSAARKGGEATE